jgi:DNA-binding response OmpR family regulator
MTAPAHVLLVDDDLQLQLLLGERLRRAGFEVSAATTAREALAVLDRRWVDLVILDLMLPSMGGEELAERIKARADIPIVIVSAIGGAESKVGLIDSFAEDYVTKPFHFEELVARINRILRRVQFRVPEQPLRLGPDLTLNLRRRRAVVGDQEVRLSKIETRLLGTLTARLGEAVSTDDLLSQVWDQVENADPAYVWVTIRRLRQKIEADPETPRYLVTDRMGGYRLVLVGQG